jgi:hypothetical protein
LEFESGLNVGDLFACVKCNHRRSETAIWPVFVEHSTHNVTATHKRKIFVKSASNENVFYGIMCPPWKQVVSQPANLLYKYRKVINMFLSMRLCSQFCGSWFHSTSQHPIMRYTLVLCFHRRLCIKVASCSQGFNKDLLCTSHVIYDLFLTCKLNL